MANAFNKFNIFVADVANKVHNLGSDTLKIMLALTAPVATNAVKADITEIAAGGGYSAGGNSVPIASSTQTSGTYKLLPSGTGNITFTSSGAFANFRYAVLYNSTPAPGNLIGWWDYGGTVTLASGESFIVALDTVNGILQLA